MEVVQPSVKIISSVVSYEDILKNIELCGRNCYHSEKNIKEGSAEKFIRGLIKSGHDSVLEHNCVTFEIVCDRAVMAQITRHRIGVSFSIESQRYNKYSDIKVILPCGIESEEQISKWSASCIMAETAYNELLELGCKPETARSVLPNCTATVIKMTMNFRALRHFLKLRLDEHAQIDCRTIARKMLYAVHEKYPIFVEDFYNEVYYV